MEETLNEKIKELTEYCGGKISFTNYSNWTISCYGPLNIFNIKSPNYQGGVMGPQNDDFSILVNMAYEAMKKDLKNGKNKKA